jgi:hypothetical protein
VLLPKLTSDHNLPTSASGVARITGICHHAKLVLWDGIFPGLATNHDPPISASQIVGIIVMSPCPYFGRFFNYKRRDVASTESGSGNWAIEIILKLLSTRRHWNFFLGRVFTILQRTGISKWHTVQNRVVYLCSFSIPNERKTTSAKWGWLLERDFILF